MFLGGVNETNIVVPASAYVAIVSLMVCLLRLYDCKQARLQQLRLLLLSP